MARLGEGLDLTGSESIRERPGAEVLCSGNPGVGHQDRNAGIIDEECCVAAGLEPKIHISCSQMRIQAGCSSSLDDQQRPLSTVVPGWIVSHRSSSGRQQICKVIERGGMISRRLYVCLGGAGTRWR